MTEVKRYPVSNGLLIIRTPEQYDAFNLKNVHVVMADDYDALKKLNEAMQHVVNIASLLNNPDDDASDDEGDYETMIELYFAVHEYRKVLASTSIKEAK